jgi:hypothetical protein
MFSTCFVLLVEKMMETLSVTAYAVPAPPRGELFEVAGRFLITSETLATGLTAFALSVTCGDSSPKGRAKNTAGSFLITLKTLATNVTAFFFSLRESWRGSA